MVNVKNDHQVLLLGDAIADSILAASCSPQTHEWQGTAFTPWMSAELDNRSAEHDPATVVWVTPAAAILPSRDVVGLHSLISRTRRGRKLR